MMRPRTSLRLLALVLVTLGLTRASIAGDTRYKVIVHPRNPVSSVDREFLRNAFLKKATAWDHGEIIRPVDLSTKFAVRDQFTQEVIKKTSAQLRSYWNQRIFSGKGAPPLEVGATADLIAYVLANPGAVGYLPADVDPGGAKVIEVK